MALKPEIQRLLEMVYRVGAPRFHELSVEQARHSFEKLVYAFRPVVPAVASTLEVPIPRGDGSVLLARYYRPLDSGTGHELPLLVFLHGGGWCVGDVASYDVLCRQLANASGCAIMSVDYRLAPENPFPAGLEDALIAYRWALKHADSIVVDAERIAVGGDSAGGNLSIVLALSAAENGLPPPRHLLLVYPCTELISSRPSRERFADGYFLDRESLQWFFSRYLGDASPDDWRLSPMRATSLGVLPDISMLTAEYDPLTDDCLAFAERARKEGCRVRYLNVSGVVHGFLTLGKLIPESNDAVLWLGRALADSLSRD